jgi:amino acid transporter
LDPGFGINPMAFIVSALSVMLLLKGVKESQKVTNFFTVLKVTLVMFMSIAALSLVQVENLTPLFPEKFNGSVGIFRGSMSSFFGYIGFDEVCCMAGEAIDPRRNMPRAVMGSISIVTVLYVIAAIGLVGMVPYDSISVTSGFPDGFEFRGYHVVAQITALGEIITLPIVVLITIMAQPRLQYAMAVDGLLPPIFSRVDASGNLWHGTLFAGIVMVAVATFVPFTYLDDLVSAGVLIAFTMTDASVLLIRQSSPQACPYLLQIMIALFNAFAFIMGLLLRFETNSEDMLYTKLNLLVLLLITIVIAVYCPKIVSENPGYHFETPLVPYLPLFGMGLNAYMIGQLEFSGLFTLVGYVGIAALFYFWYTAGDGSVSQNRLSQEYEKEISVPLAGKGGDALQDTNSIGSSCVSEDSDGVSIGTSVYVN